MRPGPLLDPGSHVNVRPLGNKRGVVLARGQDGRYKVRVENVTIWCRETDLTAVPAGRKCKSGRSASGAGESRAGSDDPAIPAARVDLHGLTVEEALGRVLEEMNRALLAGTGRLEVVHGKGTGRIRNALHRYLATVSAVGSFRVDPKNPGVTWIYFR